MPEPLDLTGLKCPLPALFTRRALAKLTPGDELEVIADDPLAAVDIPHMAHEENHAVLGVTRDGAITRFRLRKA